LTQAIVTHALSSVVTTPHQTFRATFYSHDIPTYESNFAIRRQSSQRNAQFRVTKLKKFTMLKQLVDSVVWLGGKD